MMRVLILVALLAAPSPAQDRKYEAWVVPYADRLVLTVDIKGAVKDAMAYRHPVLDKVVAGGEALRERRSGGFDSPERVDGKARRIIVRSALHLPEKKVRKLDVVEGKIPMLSGGKLVETRLEKFRHKRKKKMKVKGLAKAGADLYLWSSRGRAAVYRVTQGGDRVKELDVEGPRVESFASYGGDAPYLAILPPKKGLPRGLSLVITLRDGKKVRVPKLAPGKTRQLLKDRPLAAAGLGVSHGWEPRDILHVMTSGDDRCIVALELETAAGVLAGEHARTVPGLTNTEDRWIYPVIPKDAFVRVVVRGGAKWVDVPFSLKDVPVQR